MWVNMLPIQWEHFWASMWAKVGKLLPQGSTPLKMYVNVCQNVFITCTKVKNGNQGGSCR